MVRTLQILKSFKKNRGAVIGGIVVLLFLAAALLAPLLAPYDPYHVHENLSHLPMPPVWQDGGSWQFPLGTDEIGRDLLSRLFYGARVSLIVGLLVVTFSLTVGSLLGLISGYVGGRVDALIMRLTDILMSLPAILLAIVVVSVLGRGLINAILAVSLISVPSFLRLVRASVMAERRKEYVQAAESFGASSIRQALLHIFPNCLAPVIVQGTLGFSEGILWVAGLGFLGLGAQAPTAEWGTMLSESRRYFESDPWLVVLPGLCILLCVLAFNLMGDGLRDALDPKLKKAV